MTPQTASSFLMLHSMSCKPSVSFFILEGQNLILCFKWMISCFYSFNFSTNHTLDCNAKDWVIYLMEALTGQNASFLRVSSGSDQGSLSPPSSTRTYQESPTARTRLVSCPPVSAGSRGEVATPAQVSYS